MALERSSSKLCTLLHVNKLDLLNYNQRSSNPLLLEAICQNQWRVLFASPALSNVNMLFVQCLDSSSGLDRDFVSSESLARSNWLSVVLNCCGRCRPRNPEQPEYGVDQSASANDIPMRTNRLVFCQLKYLNKTPRALLEASPEISNVARTLNDHANRRQSNQDHLNV